jgi:hypothetical protein
MVKPDLDTLLNLLRRDILRNLPCSETNLGNFPSVVELDGFEGHGVG